MKCVLVALFAFVAVASAGVLAPAAWSGLGYSGLGYSGLGYSGLGYSGLGYSSAWGVSPYAASWAAPIAAPIARTVVAAPAIQSGYVAATRGSVHTAPLPQGPNAFSHHLNLAPAPGTW